MPKLWNRLSGVKSILILQALIGFGIVSNFAKEMIFAYYYGTGQEIELFRIAFGIPYSLFQTLASAMVGVLLPIYLNNREIDEAVHAKLTDQSQQFQFLIFIVGIITAPLQARLLAPGYSGALIDQLQIAIILCWLFYLIVSQMFPIRLLLQSENKTHLVAATSLILSVAVMAVVLPGAYVVQLSVWLLIAAHIAAAAVVLVAYIYFGKRGGVLANGFRIPSFKIYRERAVYGLLAVSFLMVLITALQRVVDRSFASVMEPGTVASMEYAYNLYTALGLMIGTTAVLMLNKPIAERFHSKPSREDFIWLGKRMLPIFIICLILAAFMAGYSQGLIRLIYERGMFNSSDTQVTSSILGYLMLAFPFMILGMVLMQVMYAVNAPLLLLILGATKLLAKFGAIYWLKDSNYAMFGLSNLLCEVVVGIFVLGYLIAVSRR
jgi:putative peptidoglycan lipid II flippase